MLAATSTTALTAALPWLALVGAGFAATLVGHRQLRAIQRSSR